MYSAVKLFSRLGVTSLLIAGIFAGVVIGASTHNALAQYRFSQPTIRSHAYYGYQYVSKSFTPGGTGYQTQAVYCPAGYVVTGGGFDTGSDTTSGFPDMVVRSSHYAGAKQAWQVGYNVVFIGDTITVYAVCAQ